MEEILIGTTDRTILVFILDPAQTDGSGKTGLVAANMTVSVIRVETDNDVIITDVTSSLNNLATLNDTHNDWGWLEVSSSLAPGWYRLDVADTVFASGAWYGALNVMITSGAGAPAPKAFRLVAVNALDGVRHGLTALPNAAAEAAGGLYTRGTGAGQINQNANGQVDSRTVGMAADVVTASAIATDAIGSAELAATAITEIQAGLSTLDAAGVRTAVGLASANLDTQLSGIQADTDNVQTRLPAALVSGRMDASVGAMAADVVTATAIATDAIGAAELAASAVSEIQAGLSSLDAAGIRAALGMASANLDTQLSTIDSVVDAIKVTTDALPNDIAEATIKKNVAFDNFMFKMFDVDGDPATGKTVTATRAIDGGAFAACTNSVAEMSDGYYSIDLSAADLNGDSIALKFTASGCKDRGFLLTPES
jgi:hypothetical protein